MRRPWGRISALALVIAIVIAGAAWMTRSFWAGAPLPDRRPKLADVESLAPMTRSSLIIAPAAIALPAIRDALERTPRDYSGKPDGPAMPLLGPNVEIAWSIARGPFSVAGRSDGLALSTALTGSLRLTGQFGPPDPGGFPRPPGFPPPPRFPGPPGMGPPGMGPLGGLPGPPPGFGPDPGRADGANQPANQPGEQRLDISGNVAITARPALRPEWRLEPNLTSQITIADASLTILGMKVSLSNDLKPLLERAINEQVAALQARVNNDPMVERAAREQWAKACRSIPIGAAAAGTPNLWLELRPTRAFAAQPRIDQSTVTLTFGVQADTRIVPNETKPDCPFPAQLEIVPQLDDGQVNIAVPVDIPFSEVNRLLTAQLKGKVFPEDKSGSFTATIQSVNLAASADRLLISLGVKANETRSWFGLGAEGTIHVWGRPVLDRARQMLRIDDIAVDVESEAVFGLLGMVARIAVPNLQKTLKENAFVDLRPLSENSRKSIEAAIAEFHKNADGVRVDAAVTRLQLAGIAFDANTLRVIAEVEGTVKVAVTALPAQ